MYVRKAKINNSNYNNISNLPYKKARTATAATSVPWWPGLLSLSLSSPLLHRAWLLRAPARYMEVARALYSCFFLSLPLSTRIREYCTHTPASPTHTPVPSTRTLASFTLLRDSAARFFYSHAGVRVVFTDSPGTPRFELPDSTSSGTS